jgi:hypothetical protein
VRVWGSGGGAHVVFVVLGSELSGSISSKGIVFVSARFTVCRRKRYVVFGRSVWCLQVNRVWGEVVKVSI